jgi:branched-chain amino acid transport system substrate-binding protein
MKKFTLTIAAVALFGTSALALAADTKVGILMDITGPIANFIPPLQNATNLAVKHVNEQGGLLDGQAIAVFGDTTGSSQGAVDAAGKLINVENVPIIMGAHVRYYHCGSRSGRHSGRCRPDFAHRHLAGHDGREGQ